MAKSWDPIAKFKCVQCEKTFKDRAGAHVTCPYCRSLYATWVDYQRFRDHKYKKQ